MIYFTVTGIEAQVLSVIILTISVFSSYVVRLIDIVTVLSQDWLNSWNDNLDLIPGGRIQRDHLDECVPSSYPDWIPTHGGGGRGPVNPRLPAPVGSHCCWTQSRIFQVKLQFQMLHHNVYHLGYPCFTAAFHPSWLFSFDPDPRARNTVWTSTVGSYFIWISLFASSQVQIQRLLSLPSPDAAKRLVLPCVHGLASHIIPLPSCVMNDSSRAVFFSISLLTLVLALTFIIGLLMFGKYFGCDPVKLNVRLSVFHLSARQGAPALVLIIMKYFLIW